MTEGDFVVVTRGEPHLIYSDRRTKLFRLWSLIDRAVVLASLDMAAVRRRFRR